MRRVFLVALLLLGPLAETGCGGGTYSCNSANQCVGQEGAMCIEHNCAFPDTSCPGSNLRWDKTASPDKRNDCVEAPAMACDGPCGDQPDMSAFVCRFDDPASRFDEACRFGE